MTTPMQVGIIGSGDVARSLGRAFITLGHSVMLGSRTPEGEKLQAVDFNAKTEELKAKAVELKGKLQAVDVKAEAEKLQAIDLKAKAEELKALALELKGKVLAVDAKAEVEKLLAEVQKLFAELVAKGEQRAA